MNVEEFLKTRGFSPGWLADTEAKDEPQEINTHQQRKDLNVLLAELEEIKNEFNKISEKKEKLQGLLKFYSKFVFN